jgi:hypothetical protein
MHCIQKKIKNVQNAHMNVFSKEDTPQSTRHWRAMIVTNNTLSCVSKKMTKFLVFLHA